MPSHNVGENNKKKDEADDTKKPMTVQEEEDEIQAEIRKLQEAKAAKTKREKKRDRERLAKLRTRQAYGMHHDVSIESAVSFVISAFSSSTLIPFFRTGF